VLGKLQIYAKVCSLYLLQEFALLFRRFGTQVEAVAITRAGFCSRLQHAVNACVRKERRTKEINKWQTFHVTKETVWHRSPTMTTLHSVHICELCLFVDVDGWAVLCFCSQYTYHVCKIPAKCLIQSPDSIMSVRESVTENNAP